MNKWKSIGFAVCLLIVGPVYMALAGDIILAGDWRTADRESAGIAPDPRDHSDAVLQVYSARAFSWRGVFAVHTWIASKPRAAPHYTVHQVLGWRAWRGLPALRSGAEVPDRSWFGSPPELLLDLRGKAAARLIPAVEAAVHRYPYPKRYRLWPGPNSNTFTAWVAREVPQLGLELPTTAIGKDYLANGSLLARAPSGTGYQISLQGLLGVLLAWKEGLELNLLGLNLGFDPLGPAIKLPGIGRLGFRLDN